MTTMKKTPSDTDTVQLWQLSDALDELFALREGAAYETDVTATTICMKIPASCREHFAEAKALFFAATRGDDVLHKATPKQVAAWIATSHDRSFLDAASSDNNDLVDLLAYAIGDINIFRARLSGRPVDALTASLGYAGLPQSRRSTVEGQVARSKSLTDRKVRNPWWNTSHLSLRYSWRNHGTGLLTRSDYEAEIAKRYTP